MKRKMIICFIIIVSTGLGYSQTLDDYYRIAAENNPALQAKYKAFEAAMQRIPQVSFLPDPVLSFGFFISPAETRLGPQQAKASLTQMFPWFGTLRASKNAAAMLAEAKYQEFLEARNKLKYELAMAYYPLYELEKWKKSEKENIIILESYLTIAHSKLSNGRGNAVDVLRVEIYLNEVQSRLKILSEKQAPLLSNFNSILGRDLAEPVFIPDSLTAEIILNPTSGDSLAQGNPAITALKLKIKASEALAELARRQGMPKMGLGLDYINVGSRSDIDPPGNGRDILMPMITVSIPFSRAKYDAAVNEMNLRKDIYNLEIEHYNNTLISSYQAAIFEFNQHSELLSLYEGHIMETQQILTLLLAAYSNSGKDFEEVLRMQQQAVEYEKLKATAEMQLYISMARYEYVTAFNL